MHLIIMGEQKRKTLLSAVESNDAFLKFVNSLMEEYSIKSSNDKSRLKCIVNQAEVIQELSRKQANHLWKDVYKLSVDTLEYICNTLNNNELLNGDRDISSLFHDSVTILEGVCLLLLGSLESNEPMITEEATQTVFLLHGSLLDLHEVDKMLSFNICMVCVKWWKKDLRSKEDVCLNAIILLLKLFASKFKDKILNSIYQIQDCLKLFSYKSNDQPSQTNQSIELLKQLLLACFSYSEMLKEQKGRKFLSLVLLLDEDFMKAIHQSIVESIKHSFQVSKAVALGNVYYLAWRTADNDMKKAFEEICIQDLMYRAVHAPRVKENNIFIALRHMLNSAVSQKGSTEVRHMITRLYTPIIWRSLKAINPVVRANSATLFLEAFPFEEEGVTENKTRTVDQDNYMQKQFTAIDNILLDSVPHIKIIGIKGLCMIFHMYWDVISVEVIAGFFKKLFGELAFDQVVNVRQAVYQGTISLLDTPCAHVPLSNLFPTCLTKSIHDTSEKVRIAVADVLLAIKQTTSMSFWKIVPIPNILAQLETDNGPVTRRLIKLIYPSFAPPNQSCQTWVIRCVNFYQRNIGAARKFYKAVGKHLLFEKTAPNHIANPTELSVVVASIELYQQTLEGNTMLLKAEFLKFVGINIYEVSTKLLEKVNPSSMSGNIPAANDDDSEEKTENGVPVTEEALAALLDSACLLWMWLYDTATTLRLSKEQKEMTKKIIMVFSKSLRSALKVTNEERNLNAIVLLFSYFPPESSPAFSQSVLPKLRSFPVNISFHLYSMFIKCMCMWNKKNQVLELVSSWLSEATNKFASSEEGKNPKANESLQVPGKPARRSARLSKQGSSSQKPTKASKSVKFIGIQHDCRPEQALKYLTCLFEVPSNSISLESLGDSQCTELLTSILTSLEKCQREVANRLSSSSMPTDLWPDKLLISAVSIYCRMLSICFLKGKRNAETEEGSNDDLQKIKKFFNWFENDILTNYQKEKTKTGTFPLGTTASQVISNLVLYRGLFNMVLAQCSNFLCCNIPVFEQVKDTLLLFAESGVNLNEYCGLTLKLMYQIHQCDLQQNFLRQKESGEIALETPRTDSTNTDDKFVRIYDVLLTALFQLARRDGDNFAQIFKKEVKGDLRLIFREQFLGFCSRQDLTSYSVLASKSIAAVLVDLYHETKSSACFTCRNVITDLPVFSASLLPIICGTQPECSHICKQTIYSLIHDEKTFAANDRDSVIHAFSHLFYTLSKDSKSKKAAACVADQLCQSVPEFQQVYMSIELKDNSTARNTSEDEGNKENSTRIPLLEQQSLEDNELF